MLEPVTDARGAALDPDRPGRCTSSATPLRICTIRTGIPGAVGAKPVVVTGDYEVGMQDQAFLGPEAGLAVPTTTAASTCTSRPSGCTSTSGRSARPSACRPEQVRLTLAGVGGAFGGREDLSMHVHACLLALHTGKPVKMVYNREESFFGHVIAIPRRCTTSTAPTGTAGSSTRGRDLPRRRGLRFVAHRPWWETRGPWGWARTCSPTWSRLLRRVHEQPAVRRDARVRLVQAAFAYEAQMDELAAALGLDPVEVAASNAIGRATRADRPVHRPAAPWPN